MVLAGLWRSSVSLICIVAACALTATQPAQATQPLRVSNNGRFLQQANGTPFFWMGDTNWRMQKLSREEVNQYLNRRRAQGFNVVQGPVLLHNNTHSESRTAYGAGNTNPNNPNPAYFEHIDYIINAADARGMYISPVVIWGDSMQALGSSLSEQRSNARNFGEWLGQRYANRNNIIWTVAGEYNILGTGPDIRQVWNALGNGLKDGSNGRALITIHASYQQDRQSSSLMFHNAGWLSFNMIQSSQSGNSGAGADNWRLVRSDYRLTPVKPVIDGEPHYEGLAGWNAFGVRRRAYWAVFAGAFGHTYGANGVWNSFEPGSVDYYPPTQPWSEAMEFPGANDMRHLRRLIESRPMLRRVPADDMLLTVAGGVPNRLIATRDQSGRYAMVYVPKRNKTVRVNTLALSDSNLKAWWYDCRTGAVQNAGTFSRSATRTFTSPASGQDWVLVIDAPSQGYPRPGVGGPRP